MAKLTNYALAATALTILSASCLIPSAMADDTATTTAEKPAAAPAEKPAKKKLSPKKRAKLKSEATNIIKDGAKKAADGEK